MFKADPTNGPDPVEVYARAARLVGKQAFPGGRLDRAVIEAALGVADLKVDRLTAALDDAYTRVRDLDALSRDVDALAPFDVDEGAHGLLNAPPPL